jgi:hypothetical protein
VIRRSGTLVRHFREEDREDKAASSAIRFSSFRIAQKNKIDQNCPLSNLIRLFENHVVSREEKSHVKSLILTPDPISELASIFSSTIKKFVHPDG